MENEKVSTRDRIQLGFTDDSHGIGFLYKIIDAPKLSLTYWIERPEFVEAVKALMDKKLDINNESVFLIMKGIYKEKYALRKSGELVDFNMSLSRRSLRKLSEVLTGDRNSWNF